MAQNNVKLNPQVFEILKKLDDLAHGINASGIFAILVIHMNGQNVSKVPVSLLVKSSQAKAKAQGVKMSENASFRAMVSKTLKLLVKNHLIIEQNLPLNSNEVCYQVSPKMAQL